jgi:hypothetical protein
MSMVNPYDFIKKAQSMPESLQKEYIGDGWNTSLDRSQARDGRAPLMDAYIENRLRSDKPITFLGFVDDLRKLWEAAGKTARIIRNTPLKEDAEFPAITYRVTRRSLNESFKDLKPRLRTTIPHPDIEDEYIELYGQIFDVWVEFNVYSLGQEEADELVIELEEFLQTYAGFFKRNGVQEILFHAQGEDEVINDGKIGIAKRTLYYTMRFEKIIVRFLNEIQQIAVQANLQHEDQN